MGNRYGRPHLAYSIKESIERQYWTDTMGLLK